MQLLVLNTTNYYLNYFLKYNFLVQLLYLYNTSAYKV